MAKIIVAYESKYGNTKRVAETIAEGAREVSGIETVVKELKEVDLENVVNYDLILLGSPNHFGGPTRGVKKFIDKLGKLRLEGKYVAVFDTYIGRDIEKAVRKMKQKIGEDASQSRILHSGLSMLVQGMKGPVSEQELAKSKEYGTKIANEIKNKF
ncbi:flavodoxin domain-containing protein [Candidatus Bathyarchaeota archaeon]|nr:flavodoxin domain-containing protein [Candidatus Bathyarchaeota archaeon]